ncbi:MAG: hypothetical protein H6617_00270 [Bdellovibrionaceae bacterium]|nr:hypothetical protein [Bdellovibrionales bacterium]MCB9253102.1 hypothetical protein [Pseudobdellovibrionaceae bacterium]
MIEVVRSIEKALSEIYNLDLPVRAEDFLLVQPTAGTVVSSGKNFESMHGAIYLQYNEAAEVADEPQLDVGIFFSDSLRETLNSTPIDKPHAWSEAQSHAVAIAGEEISHFHYLLYHALSGRSVSQLELEIQGDIDKFLLLYFSRQQWEEQCFEEVFERVFEKFSLSARLTTEQVNRYLEANQFARKCIHKHRKVLLSSENMETALKSLRRFYRLGASEKISLLAG